MSDLYCGMDARAIVVKLQILSGAVVEERCFRAVEATGDASGAFVSTVTACTSDAAPILPVVYRVVKLCIGEIARSQAPRAADNFRSVKHGNHGACFYRAARKTSI